MRVSCETVLDFPFHKDSAVTRAKHITERAGEATEVNRKNSPYRKAIILSVSAHVVLAVVLLVWYVPSRRSNSAVPTAQVGSATDASGGSSKPPQPEPLLDVSPQQVQASIDSQIEQVEKLSDERMLSELEQNLKRLDSLADEESVKQVTTTIASSIGLDQDQYAPQATPADGPFDSKTAQLQDVTRTRTDAGVWEYESILVDDEGRTMEVPMTAAEGETVYNTFEQMKKYPIAEGIYRGVVMPLIQKMLEAQQVTDQIAREAERTQRQPVGTTDTPQELDAIESP
jgi:TolA-binding protein